MISTQPCNDALYRKVRYNLADTFTGSTGTKAHSKLITYSIAGLEKA